MREIKFKVWNNVLKKMFESLDIYEMTDCRDEKHFGCYYDKRINIFLQYTGLQDVTGKDIYAGFILKNKDSEICEVKFGEYESSPDDYHSTTHLGFYLDFRKYTSEINKLNIEYKEYLIIGNIYENPDLVMSN